MTGKITRCSRLPRGLMRGLAAIIVAGGLALGPVADATEDGAPPSRAAGGGAGTPQLYGVVEIGAKGVKAYLFDLDRAESDPSCSEENDAYLKCLDEKTLPQANVNAIEERSLGKAADAVKDQVDKMRATYHVAPERIFVVGSSSMAKSEFKDTLVAAIKAKLGGEVDHRIDFVSVEQEATYDFKGILGMLPRRWRKLRQHQAAIIDIGSGNVKASFLGEVAGTPKLVTFGVDYGTKRATDEINQRRGELDFAKAADKWREAAFVPALRDQLDNNPGFGNRNRFYLVGGIVWAMSNMTRPEDRSKFPPIRPTEVDRFLTRLESPDAGRFCSDDNKQRYADIAKACETFSTDNLIAGSEILKGLSDELGFARGHKSLFFFRDSLYAWPLGYLREQVYGSANP